ncbi:MAG: ATP-binding protein [archaeon]
MVNIKENFEIIKSENTWWSNSIYESKKFRREMFDNLIKDSDNSHSILVTGPRRIGKTIILNQLVEYFIKNKISKENILFINLDDFRLTISNTKDLYEILVFFSTKIAKDGKKIIIIDEIQHIKDWQGLLKTYFDSIPDFKFYISGSSSNISYMKNSSKLVGRLHKYDLLPMSYREFSQFSSKDIKSDKIDFFKKNKKDIFEFANSLILNSNKSIFDNYFLKGGYINFINIEDIKILRKNIEDVLDLTINKDIVENFNVRNTSKFFDILRLLSKSICNPQSAYNISKTISLNSETIEDYLFFLESVFLISHLEIYSSSAKGKIRSPNKYYFKDSALLNYFNNALDKEFYLQNNYLGKVAENLVFNHLDNYSKENNIQLGYFQYKDNREIDFVLYTQFNILPIEIKYETNISNKELEAINDFIKDNNAKFGIVITKDKLELEGKILFIPLEYFLMFF